MRQVHSVSIRRPLAEVWAYTTANENAPKWAEGVVTIEPIHEAPAGVGSRYRMVVQEGRTQNTYDGEVVVWEFERRMRDKIRRDGWESEMEMDFAAEDGGRSTRVTQIVEMDLKGAVRLMMPLIWVMNRHFQRKHLGKLKALLESET